MSRRRKLALSAAALYLGYGTYWHLRHLQPRRGTR